MATKPNKTDLALKGIQRKTFGYGFYGPQMRNAKDGEYVSAARAAQKINAQQAEIEMLKLALDVAMGMHAPDMPTDSRAVPDWFVACAAVQCDLGDKDGKIRACLTHNADVVKTLPRLPVADPTELHFAFPKEV